jgi:hypothetical protein
MAEVSLPATPKPFKRRFTDAEDAAIQYLVQKMGVGRWGDIAEFIPGRNARQCRDRYEQYLSVPNHNSQWLPDDDGLLRQKVKEVGPHWVAILPFFPNRNINDLKNRWHKILARQTAGATRGVIGGPDVPSMVISDDAEYNNFSFGTWTMEDDEAMDF